MTIYSIYKQIGQEKLTKKTGSWPGCIRSNFFLLPSFHSIMSFSMAFFHFFWFLPSSSLSSPQSAGWYADAPRHDSGFPPLPLPGWLLPGWCVPPTLLHHPSVELPASPASLLLRPAKMVAGGDCRCRTDGCTQVGWLEMEEDEERDQWISSDGWYWTRAQVWSRWQGELVTC